MLKSIGLRDTNTRKSMRVPRNFSIAVQYILDEWVPPRIRDSRLLMYIPMRILMKDSTNDFLTFKDWVFKRSDKDFSNLYERTLHVQELQGETDLNPLCTKEILRLVKGKRVLEVGCGRGYLANLLSKENDVTACDIVISPSIKKKYPGVNFKSANIQSLPFKNASFDLVITTHTLEHVRDLPGAVSEIRRVAREKIIIVVPRQRPYKYTFSLHTQFFPYTWSLESAFGFTKGKTTINKLGDWLYIDDVSSPRK